MVSPTYVAGQSLQGMQYTTSDISIVGITSFGWHKLCLSVRRGFRTVLIPTDANTLFKTSETPETYGKQTIASGRSPVSVTVANLVMEDVEERALTTAGIVPRFWKRCVDDTCTHTHTHTAKIHVCTSEHDNSLLLLRATSDA